jgi:hypothetical protein
LDNYKSPGSDHIPAEFIQAGDKILQSEIHKFINSIWNKAELPEQWKEYINVPVYRKGDKNDHNNYQGISLLLTPYKILSNILLKVSNPCVEENIGDHQCWFRRNRSTTGHVLCIRQITVEKVGVQ